jgi:hypothetical protein
MSKPDNYEKSTAKYRLTSGAGFRVWARNDGSQQLIADSILLISIETCLLYLSKKCRYKGILPLTGSRKDQPVRISYTMSKKVVTVSSRTTLVTVGHMKSERKISCVIIQEKNPALGVIYTKSRFPDDLIRLSDLALYEAKKRGKNQIVCWNENMTE